MLKCEIEASKYCNEESFGLKPQFPTNLDEKPPFSWNKKLEAMVAAAERDMFNSMENEEKRGAM